MTDNLVTKISLEDYLLTSNQQEEEAHDHKEAKKRKFYVSDMGKCMRIRWLKRHGIKQEFSSHVYWVLKIGELYHDYVYKALESKGVLLESEDYISNTHFVGRFDGIIKDKKEKDLLDIKSIGGYKFDKAINGDIDEGNIAQVLTYLLLLQKDGRKDLSKARLLFVNKEPSDKIPHIAHEAVFHLTNWRKEKLEEEMETLVDYWLKQKIPPCTCPGWMKNYNAFYPFCSANEKTIEDAIELLKAGNTIVSNKKEAFVMEGGEKRILIENK